MDVGDVVLRHNPPDQVARGAKPIELEGLAKPIAARVMSVAGPGQTLVSPDAKASLPEPVGAILDRMEALAGELFAEGAKRRSDFFRDNAASQYAAEAEGAEFPRPPTGREGEDDV